MRMIRGARQRVSSLADALISYLPLSGDRLEAGATVLEPRRLSLPFEPNVTYAIGDVHGCIEKLQALEEALVDDARALNGPKLIVMLGDYVDRGPDSARVIDHLLGAPPKGFHRVCLRGNHESQLLKFLRKPSGIKDWLDFGGAQTMRSYGFDIDYLVQGAGLKRKDVVENFVAAFPASHFRFLEIRPISLTTPRFFFAHAGAKPGVSLEEQSEHDLLWIRKRFIDHRGKPFDRTIVHGHTTEDRPHVSRYRIGVDTGACRGGPLTAVRLFGTSIRTISVP